MFKYILILFIVSALNIWPEEIRIPELVEGRNAQLTIQKGQLILEGITSDTFGYNGNYLGPTLRFDNNDPVNVKIKNTIDEPTTLHWHGMHIPAEFDGGPHQIISPGDVWNPVFQINQNAATLWYHPHLMGKTAEHVYKGLAGMIIIEDEFSKGLNIPSAYGVNDIPLILQDRRLNRNGTFAYTPSMHDIMQGYTGNELLVNGGISPSFRTEGGIVRFRILNGSNSSLMRIRFDESRSFTVIASDGGFLPEQVEMTSLILSPGERYEILMDFSDEGTYRLICDVYGTETYTALEIDSEGTVKESIEAFKTARPFAVQGEENVSLERDFRMESRGMRGFSINGKTMNLNRIDFKAKQGQSEVWNVSNEGRGMMQLLHSFHVHDVQFRILTINGQPPPPHLAGPKDTVLLMPGDRVSFVLNFKDYTGIYMYHCHFLEHEDNGMMGQFEVLR